MLRFGRRARERTRRPERSRRQLTSAAADYASRVFQCPHASPAHQLQFPNEDSSEILESIGIVGNHCSASKTIDVRMRRVADCGTHSRHYVLYTCIPADTTKKKKKKQKRQQLSFLRRSATQREPLVDSAAQRRLELSGERRGVWVAHDARDDRYRRRPARSSSFPSPLLSSPDAAPNRCRCNTRVEFTRIQTHELRSAH